MKSWELGKLLGLQVERDFEPGERNSQNKTTPYSKIINH
jgi:hypothetical protein